MAPVENVDCVVGGIQMPAGQRFASKVVTLASKLLLPATASPSLRRALEETHQHGLRGKSVRQLRMKREAWP